MPQSIDQVRFQMTEFSYSRENKKGEKTHRKRWNIISAPGLGGLIIGFERWGYSQNGYAKVLNDATVNAWIEERLRKSSVEADELTIENTETLDYDAALNLMADLIKDFDLVSKNAKFPEPPIKRAQRLIAEFIEKVENMAGIYSQSHSDVVEEIEAVPEFISSYFEGAKLNRSATKADPNEKARTTSLPPSLNSYGDDWGAF